MNSPTGQTSRRIFMFDGSNDADSRKDVPFGGSLILLPILGVKSPENPNKWGADISAMVWPIFKKFGTLVQNGPLKLPER